MLETVQYLMQCLDGLCIPLQSVISTPLYRSIPYPSEEKKEQLARDTRLTVKQIRYWFTNKRTRTLKKHNVNKARQDQRQQQFRQQSVRFLSHTCFHFSEVDFVSVFLFYSNNNVVINMIMTMFYKCISSTHFELDGALSIIVFDCYISNVFQ